LLGPSINVFVQIRGPATLARSSAAPWPSVLTAALTFYNPINPFD